tara:strand:+ start:3623 stop:4354 length:732 start_codon:yes stop_codon:yes gene_type:complete
MKKILLGLFSLILIFNLSSCVELEGLLGSDDIAAGLKEALEISTDTSVVQTSIIDGYFGNAALKILFPQEADNIKKVLELPGVSQLGVPLLDAFELKMNRAAEAAAPAAKEIFITAITEITIDDALGILNGNDDAATVYLRSKADETLYNAFYPEIQSAMAAVQADVAWTEITQYYNTLSSNPTVVFAVSAAGLNLDPVDTDISAYTTNKALDGLFVVVANEEKKIRNDVTHRVTELLQKVFK